MKDTTFAGISNILATMPAAQQWTDMTATVYALAMKDWDDDLAQKTVMHALMTKKWRPAPSELREIAMSLKKVRVPNNTMHEQVRHIVIHHPSNERKQAAERLAKSGKISPLVNDVVERLGGWRNVGSMTEEQLSSGIEKEMQECLESGASDHILATPLPMLGGRETKMIGQ